MILLAQCQGDAARDPGKLITAADEAERTC